jgi:DNA-binding LacI/PurR family transcriptional regulator
MSNRFITLRDLAKELQLSTSTVSRALRNHHEVNADTRNTVLALARKLNYRANPVAQSLVNMRSRTIGVLIPEIANPFFSAVIGGIERETQRRGYNVMICQSNENYQREVELTDHLVANRVEGLIVSVSGETSDFGHFSSLLARNFPIVFFDRTAGPLMTHKVIMDDFNGARHATLHLIEQGYRRIAHIAGPIALGMARSRCDGYKEALQSAGLPVDESLIVPCKLSQESAEPIARAMLQRADPPDAIFAITDRAATGVLMAAKSLGVSIPTQLGLVGFGNLPYVTALDPPLSTVGQPASEMGEIATSLLFELAADPEQMTKSGFMARVKTMPTELIIRASSVRFSAAG